MQQVERVVRPDMNNFLIRDFLEEEVYNALMQMHPTKAPSPNGMTAQFFQKYWNIVSWRSFISFFVHTFEYKFVVSIFLKLYLFLS